MSDCQIEKAQYARRKSTAADPLHQLVGVRIRQRAAHRRPGQVHEHVIAIHLSDLTEQVCGVQVEEAPGCVHGELRPLFGQCPVLVVLPAADLLSMVLVH